MMTKNALVIVTKPNKVLKIVPKIKNYIKNTLYILLLSENKLQSVNFDNVTTRKLGSGSRYSPSIIELYKDTLFLNLDVRILLSGLRDPVLPDLNTRKQIEVVYLDNAFNTTDLQKFVSRYLKNKTQDCELVSVATDVAEEGRSPQRQDSVEKQQQPEKLYNSVVLGGTFDRLHTGHKILLSEAVLHCNKKITVGITDTNMLQTKKLWELIEPVDIRIKNVLEFLREIEPRLEYEVIPIGDVYGPTKDDPTFEMLVVSAETVRGSEKVNEMRQKNGLGPLIVHRVPLLPENYKADDIEEDKISSGNNRLRLLGTLLRPPSSRPNLQPKPYIIGLTGGIASGKTNISEYLSVNCGATVINADRLGHEVYDFGKPTYQQVVETFGPSILNDDKTIDRKALGAIVFSDKDKLSALNSIVWPAIASELRERIASLTFEDGKIPVVVFEAALLVQAEWNRYCHEIWTCIVPPDEALSRIKKRDRLDDEQAKGRLAAQLSNFEQVQSANVVFCSLWTKSFTRKQVQRAWNELQSRVPYCFPAAKVNANRHENNLTNDNGAVPVNHTKITQS